MRHDLCTEDLQLSVHDEVDVGLRAVDPDVGPDQTGANRLLALFRERMFEPSLVDRGELAELHALVRGFDPAS